MKGLPWSKYYEKMLSNETVAIEIINIIDEDEPEFTINLNSEWWDYNYNGKIQVD